MEAVEDYYGKEGCCLTCIWEVKCDWCANCKCHECSWYRLLEMPTKKKKGYCSYKFYVVVDEIIGETEKAYLIRISRWEIWIAKQAAEIVSKRKGGRVIFDVKLWLLRRIPRLRVGLMKNK